MSATVEACCGDGPRYAPKRARDFHLWNICGVLWSALTRMYDGHAKCCHCLVSGRMCVR
jgi:hypothetical protein